MKTLVLDSLPTVPIRIPDEVTFNMPPIYQKQKTKGQPLLGQQQVRYTHFVPVGDASSEIKKLLEIPQTDTAPLKPIEGYQEIMKEETAKNEENPAAPANVFGSEFKNNAKEYLASPNTYKKDSYITSKGATPIVAKNTANLANIVAVAQSSSKTRPQAKPKVKSKPKLKGSSKTKKKKSVTKKMTTFRILPRKR